MFVLPFKCNRWRHVKLTVVLVHWMFILFDYCNFNKINIKNLLFMMRSFGNFWVRLKNTGFYAAKSTKYCYKWNGCIQNAAMVNSQMCGEFKNCAKNIPSTEWHSIRTLFCINKNIYTQSATSISPLLVQISTFQLVLISSDWILQSFLHCNTFFYCVKSTAIKMRFSFLPRVRFDEFPAPENVSFADCDIVFMIDSTIADSSFCTLFSVFALSTVQKYRSCYNHTTILCAGDYAMGRCYCVP